MQETPNYNPKLTTPIVPTTCYSLVLKFDFQKCSESKRHKCEQEHYYPLAFHKWCNGRYGCWAELKDEVIEVPGKLKGKCAGQDSEVKQSACEIWLHELANQDQETDDLERALEGCETPADVKHVLQRLNRENFSPRQGGRGVRENRKAQVAVISCRLNRADYAKF